MKNKTKEQLTKEMDKLRQRITELETVDTERKKAEEELKASYQQLHANEQQLRAANQQLDASNQQLKASEKEREKLFHKMRERVKELNCFYGLSKLIEQPGITLEEIFKKMVYIISKSWHYPDITCARIVFENNEFKTDNFKKTKWKQSADIKVHENKSGYQVILKFIIL